MRVGYGILPDHLADFVWRARLPFSVNILAEEAALAALNDKAFYDATQEAVRSGRKQLYTGLTALGCKVWPSQANFLMFGMSDARRTTRRRGNIALSSRPRKQPWPGMLTRLLAADK